MALPGRIVPIPLVGGLDTKTDNKQIPAGQLFLLENARRDKDGKVSKRFGCQAFGSRVVGSNDNLSDSDALAIVGEELLQFNSQSVYSYSKGADAWSNKGAAISARVKLSPLMKNNHEQTNVDQAVAGGIALIAWEDSRGGVRATVYDITSESQIVSDVQVAGSGVGVRCSALAGYLFVIYSVGGEIRGRRVDPVSPGVFGGEVVLSSSFNSTDVALDVTPHANYMMVSFNGAGTNLYMLQVDEALNVLSTANIAESASDAITAIRDDAQLTYLVWSTGTAIRAAIYDIFGAQVVAPFLIETLSDVEVITGYPLTGGGVQIFYQVHAALAYNHRTRTALISTTGTVTGVSPFLRSVGIASKAFRYEGRGFVTLVHESQLQSTYFVARHDGEIAAKLGYGLAGGLLTRPTPSCVVERLPGVFNLAALTKSPLIATDDGNFLSFKGVSLAQVDFADQSNYSTVEIDNNSHILGGVLLNYDGQGAVEHGFHLNPENVSASQTTGGSLTLLGGYQYCVVYRWLDARGQLHQSAPSVPLSITLTGGNNRVQLTIPTLRLTGKKAPRANVEIVVYRTESNQEEFFRATSPTSPLYNDLTVDTVAYTDDLADNTLATREPIYTAGGLLENDAPPSAAFGCAWKKRLVLGGTDNDAFWLSKETATGKPVEFSAALTVNLEKLGGKATGVAPLYDKLVLFRDSAIYFIYGDGPDATGNGQWSTPELLTSDLGAISANSIATTPLGVVFQSHKGIYLLTPQLQLSYIGDMVEDYNGETITSTTVLTEEHEIRFTTLTVTLVYNYSSGLWSVNPLCGGNDSTVWQQKYCYVRRITNGEAVTVYETPDEFKDIDQFYPMRVGIGWLSFLGLAGWQRIRRLFPVGSYRSAHKLRCRIAYDYSEVYSEEQTWDASAYLGASTYGDSSPYGSELLYGGNDKPYIVNFHLARQKSTALRCILEDIELGGSGEGFDLSGLALEVAGKKGAYKAPAEARSESVG